jgi:hypothetical protein
MSFVLDYSKVDSIAKKITFKLKDEEGNKEPIDFQQAASYCFDINAILVEGNWLSARSIFISNRTKNVLIFPITLNGENSSSSTSSSYDSNNNSNDGNDSDGKHENGIIGVKYISLNGDNIIEVVITAKKKKKSKSRHFKKPSILGSKSSSDESLDSPIIHKEFKPFCGLYYSAQLRMLEAVE